MTPQYNGALFDITGGCNAKCPLCVTARETFGQRLQFISVPDFGRALDRMLELELIGLGGGIGLQNWGEPIVHPDLNGIFKALSDRSLECGISTNASKATNFHVSTSHLNSMIFSLPGWSQASYDKVHGLRFDRIVSNMESTLANLRDTGFVGHAMMNFHVYQFNVYGELEEAAEWCEKNGVAFRPYLAYINDYNLAKAYLKGEIQRDELSNISSSIFTHYVDDLIKSQPADWPCPQWGALVLDHRSNVLLCCSLPFSHQECVVGSVFELSRDEIVAGKKNAKECDECMGCGIAYWGHNVRSIKVPRKAVEVVEVSKPQQPESTIQRYLNRVLSRHPS